MTDREQLIKNLLWREVASKSTSATAGFILAAIFTFTHTFELVKYKLLIQLGSLLAISANLMRLYLAKKITRSSTLSREDMLLMKAAIWINSIAWSIVFTFASIELDFQGFNFILMMTILIGFVATSLVTLGYDKTIYLPFQFLLLLPVLFISFWKGYSGELEEARYLGLLLIIFFFYQSKQFINYRKQILQRFSYEVDLEKSLDEVKRSKEAFIQQTAQLAQASRISALGDMAGGLAHEVNNSLQVVLGSHQQIQRELDKNHILTPTLENYLRRSFASIQKIRGVVEGLKYFALQMEPGPKNDIPLEEIIDRTMTYTFEMIKAHGIRLEMPEVPHVMVHVQPFQITQILFNLIKNADDALKETSEEDRWIRFSFEVDHKTVCIKVQNSGRRIPISDQPKLFSPFFSTKDVNKGSGLSLSISRGIALDHKGGLYYEPNEEFTTFVLKLPIL